MAVSQNRGPRNRPQGIPIQVKGFEFSGIEFTV